jgi:hypothetical protein
MNEYVKNKILKKNIYFLLNLLFKYKKILSKNDNLNIFFIINFIINYINS